MSDHLKESLSALMDNEAEELELRRILKEAPDNEELLSCWSRYHLVSNLLKQQEPQQASPAVLDGVRAALAADATPRQAKAASGRGLWQALGQGAIAASVALVVLFAAHYLQDPAAGALQQSGSTDAGVSMADASGDGNDTGNLTARNANSQYVEGEFNRVVSYQEDGAELDSQTRDRLRQAIYREIEQAPRAQYSTPANFPEVPQQ